MTISAGLGIPFDSNVSSYKLGNTEKFQIVNDNGNKRLQLNADNATSKSYIALPDTILYGSLEFEVNFNFTGVHNCVPCRLNTRLISLIKN